MKFLGLLIGDDQPTPLLNDLVSGNTEERKAKLKKVIQDSYAELLAIDLTKATRAHFTEKLGELYSVTGDTRVKAARFFVSAAIYTGIPLSSFIAPSKDGTTNGVKRGRPAGRPRTAKKAVAIPIAIPVETAKTTGESKTVALVSGGTLTVSATSSFFSLNAADRQFYVDIVNKLEEYEKAPNK